MTGKSLGVVKTTPMMVQFQQLKAAHENSLLFFRMGDFYELFFEDAEKAADALDIALTKRGKHEGQDIPMCGVPVHSAESYLERLIRHGHKVAICEQMEDPAQARKRPGKTIVRRDVVRVVTPGTITEDSLLESGKHNYLAALAVSPRTGGIAWVDISTGTFRTCAIDVKEAGTAIARIDPGELLVTDEAMVQEAIAGQIEPWKSRISVADLSSFATIPAEKRLLEHFGIASLDAFGDFSRQEIAAAGAVLDYLQLTQKGLLPRLDPPVHEVTGSHLQIDQATRRNLELIQTLDGARKGSLLHAIDRTVTGPGARLLADRLAAPLAEIGAIRRRLQEVAALAGHAIISGDIRHQLRQAPDLARALSRLALGRGGPRDLAALARGLQVARELKSRLSDAEEPIARLVEEIDPLPALAAKLANTLDEQPPLLARDGGFVRSGASSELDELRQLRDQGRQLIAALEARLRDEHGIASLKIRHNNMLGYYIEVTATHRAKVPETFIQRQSMSGATRYSITELAELEQRIASAAEKAVALELEIFDDLLKLALADGMPISRNASALAALDVATGLAALAVEQDLSAPEITDGIEFDVIDGRHPVVEQSLKQAQEPFVANSCKLEDGMSLWLLTGPNMAGKSTFLRQNALIAVMAQIGSFVPAKSARIGVVDRLFSRVGAADDIARGRSTFMVEMVETATILNQATAKSLVILDEIGRGTATYDGLSIAWAVVEYLHEVNRCRGLFATHYHELTALAAKLDRLSPHFVRVKEWQGEVIFLHEVAPGSADRSYGIHVAKLAGLPKSVIKRAGAVLKRLEKGEAKSAPSELADDLPLFRAAIEQVEIQTEPSLAQRKLAEIDPDALTPREALQQLYELKKLLPD